MTAFDITDAFLERLVQRGIVCMAWTQVYDPAGSVVLSALSAAIPLMVLFYMLAIRRAKGHVAAIVGLAVAFVLAVALWGMPFGTAVSSVDRCRLVKTGIQSYYRCIIDNAVISQVFPYIDKDQNEWPVLRIRIPSDALFSHWFQNTVINESGICAEESIYQVADNDDRNQERYQN